PTMYGVDFEGNSINMYGNLIFDGASQGGWGMYYFGSGAGLNISILDDQAPGNIPTDWHRFVAYNVGPINESVSNFQNYFPTQFAAKGFRGYNAPAVDKYDFDWTDYYR